MLFRKKYKQIEESLILHKILFILWPRQVGKTTILKQLFGNIEWDKKLFLNLEIIDYHWFFQSFQTIVSFLYTNWFDPEKTFYLFLDEFHKVKNIDRLLKSLYDEYPKLKIILSWSNNIAINKSIKESFAGRKRVIYLHPLDFEESIIWQENIQADKIHSFLKNPLHASKIQYYIENFMIRWGYPEVVLQSNPTEKKQILEDIFSFRFAKDIIPEIRKMNTFNDFLKQIAARNTQMINIQQIAQETSLSWPTIEQYLTLMEQSLLLYRIRPFFSNKLKEIVKMPKIYFADNGFRNYILKSFDPNQQEKWILFENFILQEMIKQGVENENIRYRRTKNQAHEIDFILAEKKQYYEIKYTGWSISKSTQDMFVQSHKWFAGEIISSKNFLSKAFI